MTILKHDQSIFTLSFIQISSLTTSVTITKRRVVQQLENSYLILYGDSDD